MPDDVYYLPGGPTGEPTIDKFDYKVVSGEHLPCSETRVIHEFPAIKKNHSHGSCMNKVFQICPSQAKVKQKTLQKFYGTAT